MVATSLNRSPFGSRTANIMFKIDPELKRQFQEKLSNQGLSMAEWVESQIHDFVSSSDEAIAS